MIGSLSSYRFCARLSSPVIIIFLIFHFFYWSCAGGTFFICSNLYRWCAVLTYPDLQRSFCYYSAPSFSFGGSYETCIFTKGVLAYVLVNCVPGDGIYTCTIPYHRTHDILYYHQPGNRPFPASTNCCKLNSHSLKYANQPTGRFY